VLAVDSRAGGEVVGRGEVPAVFGVEASGGMTMDAPSARLTWSWMQFSSSRTLPDQPYAAIWATDSSVRRRGETEYPQVKKPERRHTAKTKPPSGAPPGGVFVRRYKAEGKQGMEVFHAYPALSFRKPDGSDSFFFLVPTVCPAPMAEDTDVEEFDIIRQRTNACACGALCEEILLLRQMYFGHSEQI
jgi:hypothetical protein